MTNDFTMACPFLSDSPEYAAGVRFGMFWAELKAGAHKVTQVVNKGDEEQFRVAASRRGYAIDHYDPVRDDSTYVVVVYQRTPRADEIDAAEGNIDDVDDGENWKVSD